MLYVVKETIFHFLMLNYLCLEGLTMNNKNNNEAKDYIRRSMFVQHNCF